MSLPASHEPNPHEPPLVRYLRALARPLSEKSLQRKVLRAQGGKALVREAYGPGTRHGRKRFIPVPPLTHVGRAHARVEEEIRRAHARGARA